MFSMLNLGSLVEKPRLSHEWVETDVTLWRYMGLAQVQCYSGESAESTHYRNQLTIIWHETSFFLISLESFVWREIFATGSAERQGRTLLLSGIHTDMSADHKHMCILLVNSPLYS